MSLEAMCVVTEKEKYFMVKYRPAGVLRNVNHMTCLKCKLQLKLGNNYSFIIVNFHAFYAKRCIDFKFSDKRNCKERTLPRLSYLDLLGKNRRERGLWGDLGVDG